MKSKILFFLICNLMICNLLISQSINFTIGPGGVFSIKDSSTTFLSLSQPTGYLSLNNSLVLPNTTGLAIGVIYKGADRFLHNYGTNNTFLGSNSGNFTMTGTNNTGIGISSLFSNTTGSSNTAVGIQSLIYNTTGSFNTAVGTFSLFSNINGAENTAVGYLSLSSNTTGAYNTAVGMSSLKNNIYGSWNTAMGDNSLFSNISGYMNTALGWGTLYSNTTGYLNTAVGESSLYSNTTGHENTALGNQSLQFNTTGSFNTSLGHSSLHANTTGQYNIALGEYSLRGNTTGFYNTSVGFGSLAGNITGNYNTAMGFGSLDANSTGFQNTAVGSSALHLNLGNYNTALGYNAGSTITTGANLTCLGIDAAPTSPTAIDQITLGNGFVTSLRCNVQTITSLSDMRDKKNIKELSLGLDFITKLKPRQFNWDKREWYEGNVSDGSKMKEAPTAGFIAQELDEAQTSENADWLNLVLKDNPEKWEATYGNLLPVVVKAVQELKTEKDTEIANLKAENEVLKSEINDLKTMKEKIAVLEQMMLDQKKNEVKDVKLTDNTK